MFRHIPNPENAFPNVVKWEDSISLDVKAVLTFVLSLNEYINIEISQFFFYKLWIWRTLWSDAKEATRAVRIPRNYFFYHVRINGENKNDNVIQNMIPL